VKSQWIRAMCGGAVTCLAILTLTSWSSSYDYFPLGIGSDWQYYSTYYGTQSVSIPGEQVVLGVTTRVRSQVEPDQGFANYWTVDSNGSVFLHGAINFTHPMEVAYWPPLKMVEAPLFVGRTWVNTGIHLYNLDGTPWDHDPIDYPVRVYTEGVLTVPAGDFYCYGVGYDTGTSPLLVGGHGMFDVFGRRVAVGELAADNSTEWYSDGVGWVQSRDWPDSQYAFRLVSYHLVPASTQATTWGRLKAMFRWVDHAGWGHTAKP
jgi:hypothetical protein